MNKQIKAGAFALGVVLWPLLSYAAGTPTSTQSLPAIKADKVKSMIRREPRAADLIPKVEQKIAALKASNPAQAARLEKAVNQILMTGASLGETRLAEDVNVLQAIAGNFKEPEATELATLQERYAKLASELDDRVLVKDFDRILHKHDRFIRYTSLGLWDKDKIADELSKMEQSVSTAPDIPFGRTELLRGLQDRRLAAVPNLVYVGTFPREDAYLSGDRRSVGMLEESSGVALPMETADFIIQSPEGVLLNLDTPNHPQSGMPFSPPLSLWMKARMLEGKVPAVTLRLLDRTAQQDYLAAGKQTTADAAKVYVPQDIIDGKLDEFLNNNIGIVAATKEAALLGLFHQFDRDAAASSFGSDGRTPFYVLADPKLAALPAAEQEAQFIKNTAKGAYTKTIAPDLSNKFGDPNVPDGPERVAAAWIHFNKLVTGKAKNIATYSTAGAFHGSKVAFKSPDHAFAGTQAWNKLEHYYPGEGVLDWVGSQAFGTDPMLDPKGLHLLESIDQFQFQQRTSKFQDTPVMLRGLAPPAGADVTQEASWIETVFQRIIPSTFPNISIIFVSVPSDLTLWSRDAAGSFRTNVASNKFYKWPLRFKMLTEAGK